MGIDGDTHLDTRRLDHLALDRREARQSVFADAWWAVYGSKVERLCIRLGGCRDGELVQPLDVVFAILPPILATTKRNHNHGRILRHHLEPANRRQVGRTVLVERGNQCDRTRRDGRDEQLVHGGRRDLGLANLNYIILSIVSTKLSRTRMRVEALASFEVDIGRLG